MMFKSTFKSLTAKSLLVAFVLGSGSVVAAENERDPLPVPLSEGKPLELELPKAKIPTITVVDKTLGVKAEFFGEASKIKDDFKSIFDKTELLLEHNNQWIYLITK